MGKTHDQTSVFNVNYLDSSITGFHVYQTSVEKAEDNLILQITVYLLSILCSPESQKLRLLVFYRTLYVAYLMYISHRG